MKAEKAKPKRKTERKTERKPESRRGLHSSETWFKPGNPGGGRPKKVVADAAFGVLCEVVTPDDWREIVGKWKERALRGDLRAIESLANRLIGLAEAPSAEGLNETTQAFLKDFYAAVGRNEAGSMAAGGVRTDAGCTTGP